MIDDNDDKYTYLFCPLGQSPEIKKSEYTLGILNSDCIVMDEDNKPTHQCKWCVPMQDGDNYFYKCAIRWWVHKLVDVNDKQHNIMEKFEEFKNEIVG